MRSVDVSDSRGHGIIVGPNSLVKDCTVLRNALGGITGGGGQVEGCLVQDNNGGFGGLGGQRMLVRRNTVMGNGSGIEAGRNSTVTHNTATGNGETGIAVDADSLVSRNTANGNGGSGICVACPSTVTHNTALGNVMNFNPIGPGSCVVLHDTFGAP
jgi:parallel beta-helix repeat protein